MNNDIKIGIVYLKCSECNTDVSVCDNCLKVFLKNQFIACNIGIKHYCEECYDKMSIKNIINAFSLSTTDFLISCTLCGSIIINCDSCGNDFKNTDNVYCNKDKHICENCYNEIKKVNK